MSRVEKTMKDLTERGYSDSQAVDVVERALRICRDDERNWNCAGDLLAGTLTWGAAIEIALEGHIIDGFKSGQYQVPRDWA